MNILQAVVLGLLQGLTEFLPVSSSGHLVLVQGLLKGFEQPGVLFDVTVHLGTMFAVVFYFRNSLVEQVKKYFWLVVVGTIPVAIVGYLFQGLVEGLFGSVGFVGYALLVTGVVNILEDIVVVGEKKLGGLGAFLVGVAQAFAIVPGISRSGSTIFTATALGTKRREAAEFSFLLSIPAILGASGLELITRGVGGGVN